MNFGRFQALLDNHTGDHVQHLRNWTMVLSERFEEALIYSNQLHAEQKRKGTKIPYFAHLLAVTALTLEDGGDEDEAIAALLHDAVEDQGGLQTLAEIRKRFGARVATIVDELSDAYTIPKPPWRKRKEAYLMHLPHASTDVLRVSLADKLHNARSTLADYRQNGEVVWDRFRGGKSGTLWYYRALVDVFKKVSSGYLTDELERVVVELEDLVQS